MKDDDVTIKQPGALRLTDLGPDKEIFTFRIPSGMITPSDLINMKMNLGGRKENKISLKGKKYSVACYDTSSLPSLPVIFLPDQDGILQQVNLNIKGSIILKHKPSAEENQSIVNLDDFRSVNHVPPADIVERHFLTTGKREIEKDKDEPSSPKKKKSKDNKKSKVEKSKCDNSIQESNLLKGSPSKKKKKTK